jgi:hypothetical protein
MQSVEREDDKQYQQHMESNIDIKLIQERHQKYGIGYECEDGHIARMIFE